MQRLLASPYPVRPLSALREAGLTVLALTPHPPAVLLSTVDLSVPRAALLVGAEGTGLSPDALATADLAVRIPMASGVDSVNVATAAAIAPLPPAGRLVVSSMERLEAIVARLPETQRVDIEEWGGEPTFRVRGKNFVFSDAEARGLAVKLSRDEAESVVATDPAVEPAGYGLGRHGWIDVTIGDVADGDRWRQIEEWVRTSYTLVAPKKLARLVLDEDTPPDDQRRR